MAKRPKKKSQKGWNRRFLKLLKKEVKRDTGPYRPTPLLNTLLKIK